MIDRILKIYGDVNTTANGFPPEKFEEIIESTGIETIKIKILNEAASGKESTAQNTTHVPFPNRRPGFVCHNSQVTQHMAIKPIWKMAE